MANTEVFSLGLGVTVINPLGQAIEWLRRDVDRLRRQADGTRLGRLIGEVIRLGLALGKVREVERQLALDQVQQDEEPIARLGAEAAAVERLRQHYLMLDRVLAGLAQLKPLQGQMTVNVFQQWHSVVQGPGGATPGKLQAPAQAPAQASKPAPGAQAGDDLDNLGKGLAAAAGAGGVAIAGALRTLPPERQRAIRERISKEWRDNRVETFGKVAKAVITAEDGEERARGVGAAVGEIGGRVLGAMAPLLFKGKGKTPGKSSNTATSRGKRQRRGESQRKARIKAQRAAARKQAAERQAEQKQEETAQEQWARFGGQLGEAAGDQVGGALFNWITAEDEPRPQGNGTFLQGEAQAASRMASSLPLIGTGKQLPLAGKLFRRAPLTAVLDTSRQVAEIYQGEAAPAEKLEGYGEAVGGLGGSLAGSSAGWLGGAAAGALIGSVVPGIGTVIGGAIGGLLGSLGGGYLGGMGGEWVGGALGKAVASVAGSDAPGASKDTGGIPGQAERLQKSVPSAPAPAVSTPASPAMATPAINQQFTFTANMPVTFNNSFDDPTTLQQLEAIARRVLDDLMRQARAVQMVDQPQP